MVNKRNRNLTPGLPDEWFERGEVPLTKQEIRCLTLSKLMLEEGQQVLDIGAGSGGLTIECALLMPGGQVWAIERDAQAVKLIRANLKKFGLENVTILEGEAASVLEGSGSFDRIIIGGSGGELPFIVKKAGSLLNPGGILVLNCILLETLSESLRLLEVNSFTDLQFIQASISRSRKMGSGMALQPLNPVFIVSARKGDS